MIQWPSKLGGKHKLVGWLNKVLSKCQASEIKAVIGGKLLPSTDGKTLVIDPPPGRPTEPERLYPFKLLKSPRNPDDDPDDSALWRTFRVRAGAYGTTPVDFTDGANKNPDDPASPVTSREFDAAIDIIVPDATAAFYFWIDATDPAAPYIDHGAVIPGTGNDDDWWNNSGFILLAVITISHSPNKAVVRQYVRDDIPRCV